MTVSPARPSDRWWRGTVPFEWDRWAWSSLRPARRWTLHRVFPPRYRRLPDTETGEGQGEDCQRRDTDKPAHGSCYKGIAWPLYRCVITGEHRSQGVQRSKSILILSDRYTSRQLLVWWFQPGQWTMSVYTRRSANVTCHYYTPLYSI